MIYEIKITKPAEEEKKVYIIRFFYGGRNYEKLL